MRAPVLFILLASSLLSGCLGEDGGPQPVQSLDDGGNATAPNTPPVADLLADVHNGTAPLNVTFTLSAGDLDGDDLTWSFDAGDGETTGEGNGSDLPMDVTVTYLAGTWNATFTVSDGTNETVRSLELVVAEAREAAGNATEDAGNATQESFAPVTFTQDILLACPQCASSDVTGDSACLAVLTHDQGLDCAFWELTPDMAGQPFIASGTFLPWVAFYPDCSGTGRIDLGLESGTVPEGAGCAVMFDLVDPLVTAVLTIG